MVIGQDFNTKDWFVYNDATGRQVRFNTEGKAKKYAWVKEYLEPMFVNTPRCSIIQIDYVVDLEVPNTRLSYSEGLVVTHEGGGKKYVNVACDSPLAMVEDMYKQCAVY